MDTWISLSLWRNPLVTFTHNFLIMFIAYRKLYTASIMHLVLGSPIIAHVLLLIVLIRHKFIALFLFMDVVSLFSTCYFTLITLFSLKMTLHYFDHSFKG